MKFKLSTGLGALSNWVCEWLECKRSWAVVDLWLDRDDYLAGAVGEVRGELKTVRSVGNEVLTRERWAVFVTGETIEEIRCCSVDESTSRYRYVVDDYPTLVDPSNGKLRELVEAGNCCLLYTSPSPRDS